MQATTNQTNLTETIDSISSYKSVRQVDDETIIDFDVDANESYEIQSSIVVNTEGYVEEATVRFGEVEEREELGIGGGIIHSAWLSMVDDELDYELVKADMGDFAPVPHLRIHRQTDECDFPTPRAEEVLDAVDTLSDTVDTVFRGSDEEVDQTIDEYL